MENGLTGEATKDLADRQVDVRAIGLERQKLGVAQTHMHDFLSGGSLCHRLLPLPLFSPGRGLATAGRASSPASGTVQFSYHANCYPAKQKIIMKQWLKWLCVHFGTVFPKRLGWLNGNAGQTWIAGEVDQLGLSGWTAKDVRGVR